MQNSEYEVLHGGLLNDGHVLRRGDTVVRRQAHPWPNAVSEALTVLRSRGFTACPQMLERLNYSTVVLTFVPGEALSDPAPKWAGTTSTLKHVAHFMRRFSEAGAHISDELRHSDWLTEPLHHQNAFFHGDPHPTNVIFNDRHRPVGIVDFELATLGSHELNMISLIFQWAPLEPVQTTCWRQFNGLPVANRAATILHEWSSAMKSSELIELGNEYISWRRNWMQKLAGLGNRAAQQLIAGTELEARHDYARAMLARVL